MPIKTRVHINSETHKTQSKLDINLYSKQLKRNICFDIKYYRLIFVSIKAGYNRAMSKRLLTVLVLAFVAVLAGAIFFLRQYVGVVQGL